jgi:hypothetical protein
VDGTGTITTAKFPISIDEISFDDLQEALIKGMNFHE